MTLNSALLTTEYAMPAEMSPYGTPIFCAWRTREVMKTVHFEPRSTGDAARTAISENV